MEVRMTSEGALVLTSNTDAESFALKMWKDKHITPLENGENDIQIIFETKRELFGMLTKSDITKLSDLLYEIKKEIGNGRDQS